MEIELSKSDLVHIKARGLTEKDISVQLELLKQGASFRHLDRPCTIGDGILKVSASDAISLAEHFDREKGNYSITKFVPASGAASRMFKRFVSWKDHEAERPELTKLIDLFEALPFFDKLKVHGRNAGASWPPADQSEVSRWIGFVLENEHLGLTELPKALIPFHQYQDHVRSSLVEQLVEASHYAENFGVIHTHFTVLPYHDGAIRDEVETHRGWLRQRSNAHQRVDLSYQKPITDTIALDEHHEPVRREDGSLLLRPGGHGSLIRNLNQINSDIIFIKNIDNVCHEDHLSTTISEKKKLGGLLMLIAETVKSAIEEIDVNGKLSDQTGVRLSKFGLDLAQAGPRSLKAFLDRPIRVCGMVKNESEPGGGPYWVKASDGEISAQIVEKSEIDVNDPTQELIMKGSTHFNPVDMVVYRKHYTGELFDLTDFIDNDACFISDKTYDGQPIKVLEWPGLWNGAMYDWLTVFVEVDSLTFNPVKEVADLLRPGHRPASD